MRPPHGRYTERTLAGRASARIFRRAVDRRQRRLANRTGGGSLQRHLLAHATAPEIVLLHSGKLATIEALPYVVERFKRAGYRFVTVGELLKLVQSDELNHPLRRAV